MEANNVAKTLMKGFNKPLILCLIEKRGRHGYDILKELGKMTGREYKPSIIYPILHELEREGYIVGNWVSKGERRLKLYEITGKGRDFLAAIKSFFSLSLREFINDLLRG